MKKHLIKKGRTIMGFVHEARNGWIYAFGKPSQPSYIAFDCESLEQGIERIEETLNITL